MGGIIGFLVAIAYVGGVWKFLAGYNNTNFGRGLLTRVPLAMLWPVLLAVNPSYRKNFQKALKGR